MNPFRFGLIGSTDSHTGIPSGDEDNFWGKFTWHEVSARRATERFVNIPEITQMEWEMAASGYAAVWATDNTRAALFDALRRKESYATTGPRITLRFFGGALAADDLARPNWVSHAYDHGVPMGGQLSGSDQAPSFLVAALKDPMGANLDRIQIVKGWARSDGSTAEQVFDVALSDDRKVGRRGKVQPVGNTVDVPNATYTNTIGAQALSTHWRDPQFDPSQPAFYYVSRDRDTHAARGRPTTPPTLAPRYPSTYPPPLKNARTRHPFGTCPNTPRSPIAGRRGALHTR